MSAPDLAWLDTLYQVLDTDFDEPPDRRSASEVLAQTRGLGELEILSWLLVEEMGPEGLESFEALIDRPGGEQLYHGVLVLTQAPLYLDHGTFEDAGVSPPAGVDGARFLVRLRDYATRGETDRVWFFDRGALQSVDASGRVTREVDDVRAFVSTLADALVGR